MAFPYAMDSTEALALQDIVLPKLAEYGWSTGNADDKGLTEYISLMLIGYKSEAEIAAELQGELLNLPPQDPNPAEFARWLFQQVEAMSSAGDKHATAVTQTAEDGAVPTSDHALLESAVLAPDAEMSEGLSSSTSEIPTGPKSMRNASGGPNSRERRMLGQINKALDRSHTGDTSLHRIKGAQGTGRIDTHAREPPRGPKNAMRNTPTGPRGSGMGRGLVSGTPQMANAFQNLSAAQQMQMLKMYEDQSRMMAQLFGPQAMMGGQMGFNNPGMNSGPFQNGPQKSLFDRTPKPKNPRKSQQDSRQQSDAMETEAHEVPTNNTSSMEVDGPLTDNTNPSVTVCHFNLNCTRPECPYVHQSPVAPPGVAIDMSSECTYGVACKNHKCVGKHPSPAKKGNFQSQQDCRFFPNCSNGANCPFRHPSTPACRNGADCNVEGCKFFHSTVMCKFNPCTNPVCAFKHEEGQKRGKFEDKVWVAGQNGGEGDGGEGKEHVSERKFVAEENGEEEFIVPGSGASQEETQIVT
ncbi:MAG: hypothetical protein M1820_009074 [Bogoriella megaspora]|nr:MAG: hypothetical protein M1820_009074 [Bogoriella megaspora]